MRFTLFTSSSQLSYVFFKSSFKDRSDMVFLFFSFLFERIPIYSPAMGIVFLRSFLQRIVPFNLLFQVR